MTNWRLVPVPAGVHIITRVFAGADLDHLVCIGELELRREDYGDLASRLGGVDGFDRQTGQPKTVTITQPKTVTITQPAPPRAPEPARYPAPGFETEPELEAGERTDDEPGAVQ